MNIFLNEYSGFCFELNFELNHVQARFNEKMNFQNVSNRAIDGRQDQEQVEQGAVEEGHFVKLTMLSYFQMYTSPGQYW